MLLSTAIQTQQDSYAQIQIQIEALQEQQRQIQAYLQRLGSIESKMESAAQLMQEAIAEVREICPDELPAYQELITGFFGNAPVAFLGAAVESVEEVSQDDVIATVAEEVQEEETQEQEQEKVPQEDAITTEIVDQTTNQIIMKGVETTVIFPTVAEVGSMTKKAVIAYWLEQCGESPALDRIPVMRQRLVAALLKRQSA